MFVCGEVPTIECFIATFFEPAMHAPAHEIYLDCNATTPVLPAARDAAVRALSGQFGNPSSSHSTGLRAKAVLDRVRAQVARVLGTGNGQLVFGSGATEGIQTAVLSALCAARARQHAGEAVNGPILLGATEHKAVPQAVAHWNQLLGLNLPVLTVPVNTQGLHDLAFLQQNLPGATLLCTMAANNETGVIADAPAHDGPVMLDIVQAVGKVAFSFAWSGADMAIVSAHKFGGPKGVGALIVRDGFEVPAILTGGGQEMGRRAGTENIIGIAGMGAAAQAAQRDLADGVWERVAEFRNILDSALSVSTNNTISVGKGGPRLPNTLNLIAPGWKGETQVMAMDLAGFAISAGSACSSGKVRASRVLTAMGFDEGLAAQAIRISLGPETTEEQVLRFAEVWQAHYAKALARAA